MTATARIALVDNVVDLDEWARRTNAETRRVMGVVVGPELSEYSPPPDEVHRARREARVYLAELMTDEEAAACTQADLEGLRANDEYDGLSPSFARLCRAADEKARRKPANPRIERLRGLMADHVAKSTRQAAQFLVREGDPERFRNWLDRHSTGEREAILQHLERCKRMRAA